MSLYIQVANMSFVGEVILLCIKSEVMPAEAVSLFFCKYIFSLRVKLIFFQSNLGETILT